MYEETKKLFDAPWEVGICEKGNPEFESVFIASKTGWLIGRDMEEETANRVVHLPELYDALMEVKNEMFIILSEGALGKSEVDYLAFFNKIQKLLKKVRDGE